MKSPLAALILVSGLALTAGLAAPVQAQVVAETGSTHATAPGAKVAQGYFTLVNRGSEERELLKITSPLSDQVLLHQTSINHEGVARMWPLAGLTLKPGETLRFEPNGRHVMFTGITRPFREGEKVPLTLQFDGGEGPFTVLLDVKPLAVAPGAAPAQHAR